MPQRNVPDAGEIVWLNFTPQARHEQALVLSPAAHNNKTSLMICCPLTTQIKKYPFEVLIGGTPPNAALADQVKTVNCEAGTQDPKAVCRRNNWQRCAPRFVR
jgi:mRNA interferase MazF